MATISEMMVEARKLLGEPSPNFPPVRSLLKATLNHCQSLFNQIANSNDAWAVQDTTLTTNPNQDEYLLTITGKPLVVYTEESSNSEHHERMIPVYELPNLLLSYEGPKNGAWGWDGYGYGYKHSAAGIAFYQKSGVDGWYAAIRPVPQVSANYKIVYTVGDWASNASMGSAPVLSEHHHLIETRVALAMLPLTRWSDDQKADMELRKMLAMSLTNDEGQFRRDFELYLRSLTNSRIGFRHSGFGY
jgi:hypothetical protein